MSERLRQLETALMNAHNAGDESAARMIAGALERERQNISPAEMQRQRAGMRLVEEFDGTKIYRAPDGEETAVTDRFSTGDPEQIARIREGRMIAPTGEQAGRQFAGEQLRSTPLGEAGTQALTYLKGLPMVGEYVDEAMGYALGPQATETARGAVAQYQAERPVESAVVGGLGTATGIGAEVLTFGGLLAGRGATKTLQAGSAMMRTGGYSALEGAVSGYGRGETPGERQEQAVVGGALGGALGMGGEAVFAIGGSAFNAAVKRYRGKSQTQIARDLGISREAAGMLSEALERTDYDAAAAAIARAGDDAMLVDATPALQELLDISLQSGGRAGEEGAERLAQRASRANQRLDEYLTAELGAPVGTAAQQREIMQSSAPLRTSLYEEGAYKAVTREGLRPGQIDWESESGQKIVELLDRIPESGHREIQTLMRLEGTPSAGRLYREENQEIVMNDMPNIREIDIMRRGLRDAEQTARRNGKIEIAEGYKSIIDGLKTELGNQTPLYLEALEVAGDVINRRTAVQDGYDILRKRTTREEVTDRFANASAGELESARRGMRIYIDDELANISRIASNPDTDVQELRKMMQLLTSRSSREKTAVVLGDAAADALNKQVDEAIVNLELSAAVARNSATAQRQALQQRGEEELAPGIVGEVLRGVAGISRQEGLPIVQSIKVISKALSDQSSAALLARRQGMYSDLARILTEGGAETGSRKQRTAVNILNRAIDNHSVLSESQAKMVTNTIRPFITRMYATMESESAAESLLAEPEGLRGTGSTNPNTRGLTVSLPTQGGSGMRDGQPIQGQ